MLAQRMGQWGRPEDDENVRGFFGERGQEHEVPMEDAYAFIPTAWILQSALSIISLLTTDRGGISEDCKRCCMGRYLLQNGLNSIYV